MDEKLINEILRPVCRIRAGDAVGSGTIVYSGKYGTYLLSNWHVVESRVEYKEVWDELLRRNVKKEFCSTVEIDINKIDNIGRSKGLITTIGDIVIGNKMQDLVLLKMRSDELFPCVDLYPEEEVELIPLLTPLACTGAALGEKPVVTFGHLNGTQIEIDKYEYWLSSAPSIFGNSGGAVFAKKDDKWLFVGIPSRVAVVFIGFGGSAVSHMGYFIPLHRIYKWLRDNCYEFIWDPSVTKEECDRRREEKRERELALAILREKS